MPLPNLNLAGELPEGIHKATIDEVIAQFGSGTPQRITVTKRLQHIYQLVKDTEHLQQLLIFGSYITAKPEPNDIDVIPFLIDSPSLTKNAFVVAQFIAPLTFST